MTKNMSKKISLGGLFCAFSIVLPQIFHLAGINNAGAVFLPMHIPVIIGGFVLGPWFGLVLGVISPLISAFATGMPPMARLPFMIVELAAYGFAAGLLYNTLSLKSKKGGIFIALISSMLFGRVAYALSLLIAGRIFGLGAASPAVAVTATVMGLPGIAIQIILIPPLIAALRKGGYLTQPPKKSAKDLLAEGGYTFVCIKDGKVSTSNLKGIAPVMSELESDKSFFKGAKVADKVIGKAAAMLLILGEVKEIYAETISEPAFDLLENYGVSFSFGKKVPYIINRQGDGMCPMEKCVLEIDDPNQAFEALKNKLVEMKK